jgi:hypothetical protein
MRPPHAHPNLPISHSLLHEHEYYHLCIRLYKIGKRRAYTECIHSQQKEVSNSPVFKCAIW